MSDHRLRLGIPKGSLQETTQNLFRRAGYNLRISGRSYYPDIDDPEIECILIRPQEMARYVGQGILDCAITGLDWILETGADVEELADLRAPWPNYGAVRWVMASKEGSRFDSVNDLQGKRIATEAIAAAMRVLLSMNVPRDQVDAVLKMLPTLATPTVSTLADPAWVEMSTVVDETLVRELIPGLHAAGARSIIELPISKIVE